jgi:hypothetical protein
MSWQSSAQMHEARAAQLQVQLDRALDEKRQLEDQLQEALQETIAAYQFTKPPVNIDTGAKVSNTGAGTVKLPDGATGAGLSVLGVAAVVIAVVFFLFKRK